MENQWEIADDCLFALGLLKSESAIDLLFNAYLSDSHKKDMAKSALIKIGEPALKAIMQKPDNYKNLWIYEEIGMRNPKTLTSLYKIGNFENRKDIIYTLGEIRCKQTAPLLISCLQETETELRQKAAEALGKIGDKRATEPLIELTIHNLPKVREKAIESLGLLADQQAVLLLFRCIDDSPNTLRNIIFRSFHNIGAETLDILVGTDKTEIKNYASNLKLVIDSLKQFFPNISFSENGRLGNGAK